MADLKLIKNDKLVSVEIKSTGEEWTNYIQKAEKTLIENLELKGFRKGKVPENIAKKNISEEDLFNKAADLLIDKESNKAIELLSKEKIASRPTFKVNKISRDEIEAILESVAMPNVKIGDRSSIKVEMKVEEVSDEEIQNELKQLDSILTKEIEKSKESTISDGDIVNLDFLGKVDGKAFEGGESKGYNLKIGSKQFVDNFEEQLIGMNVGDEKNITVKFPEQYPSEELKGKEATFDVKINNIKTIAKLEGEELSSKLKEFGFDSKDEVVLKIKEASKEKKVSEAEDKYFREYFDEIVKLKDTKISIPDVLVDEEIQQEWKRLEAQIAQNGMKMDDYLKMLKLSKEEFKEQNLKESSVKRIRDGLIYSTLVEDLNIKVSEEELEKEYKKISEKNKADINEVKKQINKHSLENNIIYKKLIENISK